MERTPAHALAPIIVALVIVAVTYFGIGYLGLATMVVISGSAVLAYFVWLATAWRRPIDPSVVQPTYFVLIAMELIHMAEEQITNFPGSLRRIFDIPPTFNLLAHAVLLMGFVNALAVLAGVGLKSRHEMIRLIASFVVWFYVIGPGLVNAVAHVTFPFIAHEVYFSGIVTVILPTVAGVATLLRLVESDRRGERRQYAGATSN